MIITKVHIEKFRGFKDQEFEVGSMLTAIAGQNGTQKSTLLGMITQTFTLGKDKNPMGVERPLCGGNYRSSFSDKFRLSQKFDLPGMHEWTLFFDDGSDYTIESIPRSKAESIRFWQKGMRDKGDGYKQYPTIFLSLKRVLPVAESGTVSVSESEKLTEEELMEFKNLHDKILITESNIESASFLESTNKQTIGITTDKYDWNENSVGQDNLGKIILALFSFKRLKNKYKQDYAGGILAIDELDATMYPASQKQLLDVLRKYASKLQLQIFFTTHSLSLLESMDDLVTECSKKSETCSQARIVYLKKQDGNVVIKSGLTFNDIMLNLQVVQDKKVAQRKIPVYTEDKETILFARHLLKGQLSRLNFIDISFSCSILIQLAAKKIPAFIAPESIIIVDGDVRRNKKQMKDVLKSNNVLILPTEKSPEQMTAEFLHDLSDTDSLWECVSVGYNKQVCFRDFLLDEIMNDRTRAKEWFRRELLKWNKTTSKILAAMFQKYPDERLRFIEEYKALMELYPVR